MAKEKVQIKYRQSNDQRLYFILYFFFSHWIVWTLFCTFSFVIGLSVFYFVLFLWPLDCLYFILFFFFSHWIVCTLLQYKVDNPMAKEKVQNKVQAIQGPKKKYKIK
jgi:hypothetical protein